MQDRELKLDLIRATDSTERDDKYILTDAHNPLGKLQERQSLRHWSSAYICSFDLGLADQRPICSNETDLAERVLGNLLNVSRRVLYRVCCIALVFSVRGSHCHPKYFGRVLPWLPGAGALALFIDGLTAVATDTLLRHKGATPPHVRPPPNIITYLFFPRPPYCHCTTCLAVANPTFTFFP
jgi:hypothetical protein